MRRIDTCEEGQAHGPVREIYQQIESSLGVPFVGAIFRAFGMSPMVLGSVWEQIQPNVNTKAFADLSQRLRRQADALAQSTFEYDDLYSWMQSHEFHAEDIRMIRYVHELFHHLDSDLLLISAAITAALTGISDSRVVRRNAEPLSEGDKPEYSIRVPQIMFEQAPAEVKEDYFDMVAVMGIPLIPDEYQAMAKWPKLLRKVWTDMKPVMRSTTFIEEAHALSALALESAQELPHPVNLDIPGEEAKKIAETLMSLYARMAITVGAVRWMIGEGERTARAFGSGTPGS